MNQVSDKFVVQNLAFLKKKSCHLRKNLKIDNFFYSIKKQSNQNKELKYQRKNIVCLRWSLSSKVKRSRAAFRILAKVYLTLHTSRLFFKPYSPMSFNSWSKRDFSNGRRGVVKTLLRFDWIRLFTILAVGINFLNFRV